MAEFEKGGVAVLHSTNKNYSSEDNQSAMEIENKLDTNTMIHRNTVISLITENISIQTAIHEDLLVDILSRLPTKYLTRCNCVSKLWNRSFTKKAFVFRHLSAIPRSIIQPKLNLFFRHNTGLHLLSFDLPTSSIMNRVEVQGKDVTLPRVVKKFCHFSNSIDGLVCLFDHYNGSSIYIMSLRTLDYILLPETEVGNSTTCSTLLLWCSLGYDPISNEYKVARAISRKHTGKENRCNNTYDILTLGSPESWTPIQHDRVPSRLRQGSITFKLTANSFCLDGITYWMQTNHDDSAMLHSIVALSVRGGDIQAFDVEQVVGQPSSYEMDYYLTHLKGCPTFFYKKRGSDEIHQSTLLDHTNPNATWRKTAIVNPEFSSGVFPRRGLYAGGNVIISSTKWTAYMNYCSDLVNQAYLLPKLDGIYIWKLDYSGFEKFYEVNLIVNSLSIVK